MTLRRAHACFVAASLAVVASMTVSAGKAAQSPGVKKVAAATAPAAPVAHETPVAYREMLTKYCITCHNEKAKIPAGAPLALEKANLDDPGATADVWEKVVRKLGVGAMPPQGSPTPGPEMLDKFRTTLAATLDASAAKKNNPGRYVLHRLNRTEYANAVRDLLGVTVDVAELLPSDGGDFGFDNIASALKTSPLLLERYLTAALRVSDLAVGDASAEPGTVTYSVSTVVTQREHVEGLPLGTRGGLRVMHPFPADGEYVLSGRLLRTVAEGYVGVEGQETPHQFIITLDGEQVFSAAIGGKADHDSSGKNITVSREELDKRMTAPRMRIKAGVHEVGFTFIEQPVQEQNVWQPVLRDSLEAHNPSGIPRLRTGNIEGPYNISGISDTPTRKRLFVCTPSAPASAKAAAGSGRGSSATEANGSTQALRSSPVIDASGTTQSRRSSPVIDASGTTQPRRSSPSNDASGTTQSRRSSPVIDASGTTQSRRSSPSNDASEVGCAQKILSAVARRAFRRPVVAADVAAPMDFYRQARKDGGDFNAGIRAGLSRILASPAFLFRSESDPASLSAGAAHRITDLELASRLSFFLWSSIPDDELLNLAVAGRLHTPTVLAQQVRRMIADSRSDALMTGFAGQWLQLRNLDKVTPDLLMFPDFDDNVRQAFRRETELFFTSIVRENRSALSLLDADYTFVNERLARHYGIPGVYGSRFRRVQVTDPNRRGLLGQGSILSLTSVANRTSPILRGKYIISNFLNTPPLPPPANVPQLEASAPKDRPSTVREQLEIHRKNAVCASCHRNIDPVGFALENFDAVGQWQQKTKDGLTIDSAGVLADGTHVDGPVALRNALLARPNVFVGTLTEKLMTYALGRGLEPIDMPVVRSVVARAARDKYAMHSLVLGIVESAPFQMRTKLGTQGTQMTALQAAAKE